MGALAESIRRVTIEKLGKEGWQRNVKTVEQMWEGIRQAIEGWDLSYPQQVRLYQDGLPHCGREVEIVTDLANAGSRNHQLLLYLMKKGATLMGTESPELLLEEYGLIQQVLAASDLEEAARIEERQKTMSQTLLERRDQYIAERINDTLCAGETGILFLGMLHSLEGRLAPDIKLSYPIHLPLWLGRAKP